MGPYPVYWFGHYGDGYIVENDPESDAEIDKEWDNPSEFFATKD